MSINVGERQQCPQCQVKIGRGRKCGDSLWNRVANNYRSKVISSSGFGDYRNSRWRPPKLEMEMTIERNEYCDPIATAIPTFVTVPDSSVILPTLSDVC